jgi:hypothetical protein
MSERLTRFPELLTASGAIGLLAVVSQLFSVYRDSDPGSPLGRFSLMAAALPHLPVIVVAIVLTLWGSWSTAGRGLRWTITGGLGILALGSLVLLPVLIQDAGSHAFGVPQEQLLRFRFQVVRYLLYLGVLAGLLLWSLWKYRRTPPAAA